MHGFDIYFILLIMTVSLCIAVFSIWFIAYYQETKREASYKLVLESDQETAFLFDDANLIDATESAYKLIGPKTHKTSDLERLITAFSSRFSTLSNDLSALGSEGELTIIPDNPNDTARIKAQWWDGFSRLVFVDTNAESETPLVENTNITALESELDTLRNTVRLAPYLVWQETANGEINWANAAYLSLANLISSNSSNNSWPPARVFDISKNVIDDLDPKTFRTSVKPSGSEYPLWFELSCKQVNETILCFAIPADSAVKAETSQKEFIQTLTKTFAHISIGLAIFDKSRKLVLFNPALTDMTKLPIDFLSLQPTLFAMLDQLRENKRMPEPKDYKSWRDKMAALEEAAKDGTYEEVWDLPGGLTYRVTGRPHPDGAVALMFEDISAEISLTRNFRYELEIGQSVLDTLDDAVVVFSSTGSIIMSNAAYSDLWGVDPSSTFGEIGITDAIKNWQEICDPTPLWNELQVFIGSSGHRKEWYGDAFLDDGRPLACRFSPLSGNTTLVQFRILQPADSLIKQSGKQQLFT